MYCWWIVIGLRVWRGCVPSGVYTIIGRPHNGTPAPCTLIKRYAPIYSLWSSHRSTCSVFEVTTQRSSFSEILTNHTCAVFVNILLSKVMSQCTNLWWGRRARVTYMVIFWKILQQNLTINQLINQSMNQPIKQWMSQLINESSNQLINQGNQLIINKRINQSDQQISLLQSSNLCICPTCCDS